MTAAAATPVAVERYGPPVRGAGAADVTVFGPSSSAAGGPDTPEAIARRRAALLEDDAAWLAGNRRRRCSSAELDEAGS